MVLVKILVGYDSRHVLQRVPGRDEAPCQRLGCLVTAGEEHRDVRDSALGEDHDVGAGSTGTTPPLDVVGTVCCASVNAASSFSARTLIDTPVTKLTW